MVMTYVIFQNTFYEKDIFVGNEDGKRRIGTQVSTRLYRISSSYIEDPSKKEVCIANLNRVRLCPFITYLEDTDCKVVYLD